MDGKTLARLFWDRIWNDGDLDACDSLVDPEFILRTADGDIRGPDGLKRYVMAMRNAFPDIHFEVQEEVEEGDSVVHLWCGKGTQRGALGDIPATGRSISLTGASFFRIRGDRIVLDRPVEDRLGMLQQLGVVATSP